MLWKPKKRVYLSCLQGSKEFEKLHQGRCMATSLEGSTGRGERTPQAETRAQAGQEMAGLGVNWLVLLCVQTHVSMRGQEGQRLVQT